jgi:FkbH-like protein
MLLCLCSKNNEDDVQAVFSQRSEFPLQMTHFAGWRLNWSPKSANLRSLAEELKLGLDSFIFLDDNPVECAEVQANCPEVLTLQLPDDPRQIPDFLNHCWAFDHLSVTAEDSKRAEVYQQNRLRDELRAQTPTLEEFLAGLVLRVSIEPVAPAHWTRVAQLTQRTNQFNFTTRRMTEQELAGHLSSSQGCVVRVSDRFGDYGLVGVVLYQVCGDRLSVDNALLSCRVLGRGIEHRILARLGEIARQQKLNWIDIKFVPSARNKPALDFLEECCGAYKQPLNGGLMFRIPARFAASIAFHPKETGQSRGPESLGPSSGSPGRAGWGRFDLCRAIALEAGDVEKIEDRLRVTVSGRAGARAKYVPPSNVLERQLCKLWQDLLRIEPVGVNDDFFELGGHSLMAVRLFAEIEKLLGRKFPLVTLFQASTIAQLARVLSEDQGAGSLLVPIQPNGNKPPLFLIHGAGGDVLWGYANLATHLPPDQPVYGIRSHDRQWAEEKIHLEEMAHAYVEVVRGRQPRGPYYLGGYCFGGNVAYEMARQLRMQGEQVDLVILLDTAPANAGYETVPWWRPSFFWRFARNARFWLGDFAALDSIDRRRLVGRKLRAFARKLKKHLGFNRGSPERFNVEEVIDPRHFPEHELKLWQIHLEALIAHVERPYSGRVVLLRTRGQPLFCSLEEDFCWRKLVHGAFTLRCIPGSHENIFMEPNVRVLAAELATLLQPTRSSQLTPARTFEKGQTSEVANRL